MRTMIKAMFILLIAQYVFGMFINMFGNDDPSKRTQAASMAFASHMIIGLLLVIGAAVTLYFAVKQTEKKIRRNAIGGFFSTLIAFIAGIATLSLKDTSSEIASFVMALGFLGAFANYVYLWFLLRKDSILHA